MSARILILLIFAIPFLEIISISVVAALVGWLMTLILLVLGASFGLWLVRGAWREAMIAVRQQNSEGNKGFSVLTGISRPAIAGILLIIPGFLSDFLAFILLISGKKLRFSGSPPSNTDPKMIDLSRSDYHDIRDKR